MFTELFLFELKFRARRIDTYFYILAVFIFSLISVDFLFEGEFGAMAKNSPVILARTMGITTALLLLIVSMISGTAILRDFNNNTHALLFSYPFTKFEYLSGRYLGSFLTVLIIFSAMPIGMMLSPYLPWQDPTDFLAFNFAAFIQPFLWLVTPTLFFSSALFFVTGLLTRKLLLVYIQAFFFLLIYLIALRFAAGSDDLFITTLLEPFTFQSVRIVTATWTVIERNTLLVPIEGFLLFNRILWMGLGSLSLFIGYYFFRFDTVADSRKKMKKVLSSSFEKDQNQSTSLIANYKPTFSGYSVLSQFIHQLGFNIRLIVSEVSFWAILLIAIGTVAINGFNMGTTFGVDNIPATYLIIGELVELTVIFFFGIILFYSGELIWKERDVKVNSLTDSLPAQGWVLIGSKVISLLLLLSGLIGVMILSGIGFQIYHNYFDFQISLYLTAFYLEIFPFLLLVTVVSFIVQILTNHKYLAHIVTAIVLVFSTIGFQLMGFQHPLITFGGTFLPTYSDMSGYSQIITSFLWIKTYWISISFLALALTITLFPRGVESDLSKRIRKFWVNFSPEIRNTALILFLMFIGSGGYVFYQINIKNEYFSSNEELTLRADYEKQFKQYLNFPQPEMASVNLELDIYPKGRSYLLNGSYNLINKTDSIIDTLLIQKLPNQQVKLSFPDQTAVTSIDSSDSNFGFYKLALNQRLRPNENVELALQQRFTSSEFSTELNPNLLENGTLIENYQFPSIGYMDDIEISDQAFRNEFNLTEKVRTTDLNDPVYSRIGKADGDGEYIKFNLIVSTDSSQIAVAPGSLLDSWTVNNRNYYHYSSEQKISNLYSIVSANYEKVSSSIELQNKSGSPEPVELEIYYHEGHEFNLESMMNGMKTSLQYFSDHYSPFQFSELRITEVPLYHDRAQSLPGLITKAENMGFTLDISNEETPDLPFFITAHEVSHQWWGDQVNPANVQGQTMLSEMLAQYSALSVFQNNFSKEHVYELLRWNMRQYFKQRSQEEVQEQPLYLVESGQDYVHYRKGLLVMNTFQNMVSEDKINGALSDFIIDWNSFDGLRFHQENRYPKSTDLLEYFYSITPDNLMESVIELFEDVIIYDNRVVKAQIEELSNAEYSIEVQLHVNKSRVLGLESEEEIEFTRPIEIGFYQLDEYGIEHLIELREITIDPTINVYTFELPLRPDFVKLDPNLILLDKNIIDNRRKVD